MNYRPVSRWNVETLGRSYSVQINIKKEPSICSFSLEVASGVGLASLGTIYLYTGYYNGN
ncbi:hypothetical protein IR083_04020 [Dysgonomonas sp. GY75]|uniref:hypothetical protein n=1 Tax=Dysgonomonas sp. GY75 TaxID=2780419 RepID=UPI0018832095|nr:hypothetical protein [Dysgonomonas sp. GY75]MBF0647980.1 hypothetical protein [Dysgonomonas sp. GY75]